MSNSQSLLYRLNQAKQTFVREVEQGLETCLKDGLLLAIAPHILPTILRLQEEGEEPYSIGQIVGEKVGSSVACAAWVITTAGYIDCLQQGSPWLALPVATNLLSFVYSKKK